MKTVTYKNGFQGVYDETFRPGGLITAYRKGYHEFIQYQHRKDCGEEQVPLIHYKTICNFNGKACKSATIHTCDGAYCRKASEHIQKSIKAKKEEINTLLGILEKIS